MTTRGLLQMALNALEVHTFMTRPVHESTEAMAAISAHLAKPEPEPVAWKWDADIGGGVHFQKNTMYPMLCQPLYALKD